MTARWKGPVVVQTDFKELGPKRQGKVRDIYDLGDTLLLIATDRISAFDVVLPDPIPGKGVLLTRMSAFWFNWLWAMEDIVPHHLITINVDEFPAACRPHRELLTGRSMLVQKVNPLPVECIVRGYLAGSGWKEYSRSGTVCGLSLPPGLTESAKLPEPIFTPSTKAVSGHDENISFQEAAGRVGEAVAKEIREASLKIYQRAAEYAAERGILIADTKFEFGVAPDTEQLVLIDEVLTPDSSRFWPKDGYRPGRPQPSFDKQFVRDALDALGWNHQPPAPRLPPDVITQTADKYDEALRRLTGEE
ncbi:MAG TPA: phosphoribosylaminoimidazolesuccinocarboxamide synthase [Nitrospiria bacterium]|nr:phosphoribosylaminoimidazolesuccinocarboxamide synthase [Nitrospiria bacterium]